MSSRYDPADETDPGGRRPKSPLEPVRSFPWKRVAAVLIVAAIGVAAAFNVDLCGLARGVGLTLDACPAAPAP